MHSSSWGSTPTLSVILPVYDAMPWLTFAVRDMLKQRLRSDAPIELLVAFDGGTDGSLAFLQQLVEAMGPNRASDEPVVTASSPMEPDEAVLNPALRQPMRALEGVDHPSFAGATITPEKCEPLSAAEVARAARPEHRLRLLRRADGRNRGQGAAMTLALQHARASLIAQMESDDERASPEAFALMLALLEAHPEWDGVSCLIELIGWERPGMQSYAAWQNSLCTPAQMASGRFIEIPALHQTAIFRRAAVDAVLATTRGAYRDGLLESASALESASPQETSASAAEAQLVDSEAAHSAQLDTPVDLWWWLTFFHIGGRCGKVSGDEPLFGWRQHPRQHTRTHGRLSIGNLRRIKVHFLLCHGGPLDGCKRVVVISVGTTLSGWAADIRAHPNGRAIDVVEVAWVPGKRGNAPLPLAARLCIDSSIPAPAAPAGSKRTRHEDDVGDGAHSDSGACGKVVRVWAFGREEIRRKVKEQVRDIDEMVTDVFVA